MILNSISHIECKFQKDWWVNKKRPNLATASLNVGGLSGSALYFYVRCKHLFIINKLVPGI